MEKGLPTLDAVARSLTERSVPGLAVIVDGPDAELRACAGVADLRTGAATTVDTIHLWFSMTKIVTATAVMMLVERGLLALDDLARELVPEFPEARRGEPQALVRHLLSHSAGLSNPLPVRWVHPASEPGRDSGEFARELLSRQRLRRPAGERAAYSNVGYIALGEVVRAAAGVPYEEFVSTEILAPLGLERTGFDYSQLPDDDVATGYQRRLSAMAALLRVVLPPGIVAGHDGPWLRFARFCVDGAAYGGLIGSAADAARFMALHLHGGELEGVRLLRPETVATMQTVRARGRRLEVGFGWLRRGGAVGADTWEHLGGGGGFWNMMRLLPGGAGVLAMGNSTRYDHEALAAAAVGATR